jgi:hypothetical protein
MLLRCLVPTEYRRPSTYNTSIVIGTVRMLPIGGESGARPALDTVVPVFLFLQITAWRNESQCLCVRLDLPRAVHSAARDKTRETCRRSRDQYLVPLGVLFEYW